MFSSSKILILLSSSKDSAQTRPSSGQELKRFVDSLDSEKATFVSIFRHGFREIQLFLDHFQVIYIYQLNQKNEDNLFSI